MEETKTMVIMERYYNYLVHLYKKEEYILKSKKDMPHSTHTTFITITFCSCCTVRLYWTDRTTCIYLVLDCSMQLLLWRKNCFSVGLSLLLLAWNFCQRTAVQEVSDLVEMGAEGSCVLSQGSKNCARGERAANELSGIVDKDFVALSCLQL